MKKKKKMNKTVCGQCGGVFLTRKDRRIHQCRLHRNNQQAPKHGGKGMT